MRSIFVEDNPAPKLEDGLTTRQEVEEVIASANKLALGGGCVKVDTDPLVSASGNEKPYRITFANGQTVNAGVLKGKLRNAAIVNKLAELQAELAAPGLNGPEGVAWFCDEASYHAARTAAAAAGLPVMGGGYLGDTGVPGEQTKDILAIGQTSFPVPPQGNAPQNYVIVFQPIKPGTEAPVCNAAFLAHMILTAGADGAKAFVEARSVPKGWRAS